jgi:hypothetical protein
MRLFRLIYQRIEFTSYLLFFGICAVTFAAEASYPQFSGDTPNSPLKIDFTPVNDLLDANVINMGPSKRASAKRAKASIGTRFRPFVAIKTHNESNRFTYELVKANKHEDKINAIKSYLESLPSKIPLNLYSKNEQLAYWFNLYNVTLINEIVKIYPRVGLKKTLTGTNSILNQKLVNIGGVALSLNDIQHDILDENYNKNPLIIYGLYQGHIGSPNINKKAYSGKNVYKLLKANATEFINSNRGTMASSHVLEISSYYARNADYFPDFDNDIKAHLLQFSDEETSKKINQSNLVDASTNNWKISDLYGSVRVFGGSATFQIIADKDKTNTGKFNLTPKQSNRIKQLLKVRAKNFGTTSVTVTDLKSE